MEEIDGIFNGHSLAVLTLLDAIERSDGDPRFDSPYRVGYPVSRLYFTISQKDVVEEMVGAGYIEESKMYGRRLMRITDRGHWLLDLLIDGGFVDRGSVMEAAGDLYERGKVKIAYSTQKKYEERKRKGRMEE